MRKLYQIGNRKVGNDTLIFNICSATDCPSRKIGMCKIADKCYARKAEYVYKHSIKFRNAQKDFFQKCSADQLSGMLLSALYENPKVKYIRFNECGDFANYDELEKIIIICGLISINNPNIIFYFNTSRIDIYEKFIELIKNYNIIALDTLTKVIINGSFFMADNQFIPIKTIPENAQYVCAMKCINCDLCKTKGNKTIYCKIH